MAARPRPRLLRHTSWIAAVVAQTLFPGASLSQTPPPAALTLEQAVRLARENNPLFLQQSNDLDVARSSVRAARGGLLPRAVAQSGVGYTASGERRFGSVQFGEQPHYYSSDYSVGVSYELSGATLLQPGVERSRQRSVERRVVGAAASLDAQVSQQYLAALQAREQVVQAERELARAGEYLRLAQARLAVGAATPLDVRRAEVQQGRAEVARVQARNTAAIAVLSLGQLIGVAVDPSVELTSRFAIFEPRWQPDELVRAALEANPSLQAAVASQQAAETSVKSARSSYLPSLSLSVGVRGSVYQAGDVNPLIAGQLEGLRGAFRQCQGQNEIRTRLNLAPSPCLNPEDAAVQAEVRSRMERQNRGFPFGYVRQPLGASLSLSLPLFQGFSRRLGVDQSRAAAADAQLQVRAEQLRLQQEVGAAVRNLETAHQTALLQAQVRANAAEELRLAQERFRFGAAGSIEVTDAQTNLARAEKDEIDAVYNFHRTLAALEALVGRPLR